MDNLSNCILSDTVERLPVVHKGIHREKAEYHGHFGEGTYGAPNFIE